MPKLWWESMEEECPITLEPLRELAYPPFLLHRHYFDGIALASYMVSRGAFLNPLTREPLTWVDARQLDDYVRLYDTSTQSVHISEAFGLHSNIQSKVGDARRAAYLRNEATAALCGLFVYRRERRQRVEPTESTTKTRRQTLPRCGFHLNYPGAPATSAVDSVEGFTLIDDDEQHVVNSEKQDWNELQQAFPKLSTAAVPAAVQPDAAFLNKVQQTAHELLRQEQQRHQYLQQGKALLDEQSKQRREQLRMYHGQQRQQNEVARTQQRQEQAELEAARSEINKWREQQWKDLQRRSEEQAEREQRQQLAQIPEKEQQEQVTNIAIVEETTHVEVQKAAKAAAKRQRAKDRKKAQKVEAAREAEAKANLAEVEAARKVASIHCASCHEGILDCGFEKGSYKFCSPKCARTGLIL
jgi:hypothetical protein